MRRGHEVVVFALFLGFDGAVAANRLAATTTSFGTHEAHFDTTVDAAAIAGDSVLVVALFRIDSYAISAFERHARLTFDPTVVSGFDVAECVTAVTSYAVAVVAVLRRSLSPVSTLLTGLPDHRTHEADLELARGAAAVPVAEVVVVARFTDFEQRVATDHARNTFERAREAGFHRRTVGTAAIAAASVSVIAYLAGLDTAITAPLTLPAL